MPETAPTSPASIALYGPSAVGLGIVASVAGSGLGASLAWLGGASGDALAGGAASAALLVGSWLLAWGLAALTGPYRPTTAGMAWLALSTARLLILVLAGIALALTAPTMGLGLWLALLLGGLAAVALDSAMGLRTFRRHQLTHLPARDSGHDLAPGPSASLSPSTGGSR